MNWEPIKGDKVIWRWNKNANGFSQDEIMDITDQFIQFGERWENPRYQSWIKREEIEIHPIPSKTNL